MSETGFDGGAQLGQSRVYVLYLVVLALLFARPLAGLAQYAFRTDLHSHILLVPAVSGYLLYVRRRTLPARSSPSVAGVLATGAIGVAAMAAAVGWPGLSANGTLALSTLAFVGFVAAGGFYFLGAGWMAAASFPVAFLLFMIPLPDAAVSWLEHASALASSEATAAYFGITGTPVVRDATVFELPGVVLKVGQECSGIRSSWVLFITSLLASHLFLTSPWRKALLVASVIVLGVLRNGFRILVIGLLCVHVGPHMIDSPIHRRGGPVFFALSLVPLFLVLWWLRRGERTVGPRTEAS